MNWRPEGWQQNPCEDCLNIQKDSYGYLCDLACGGHAAYVNQEYGADLMLKALMKLAEESPTKTFTIDANEYHIYKVSGG